jgi:hypothetical protein
MDAYRRHTDVSSSATRQCTRKASAARQSTDRKCPRQWRRGICKATSWMLSATLHSFHSQLLMQHCLRAAVQAGRGRRQRTPSERLRAGKGQEGGQTRASGGGRRWSNGRKAVDALNLSTLHVVFDASVAVGSREKGVAEAAVRARGRRENEAKGQSALCARSNHDRDLHALCSNLCPLSFPLCVCRPCVCVCRSSGEGAAPRPAPTQRL